jgi:hypothetical protein
MGSSCDTDLLAVVPHLLANTRKEGQGATIIIICAAFLGEQEHRVSYRQ